MLETIIKAHQFYVNGSSKHQIFEFLLEHLLELTQSEYGFIGEIMYKDGIPFLRTNAITNIAWTPELNEMYNQRREIGWDFMNLDNLFGLVINENKIIISNNPRTDERRGGHYKIPHGHPPLNAFAGIPFYHKKKMIGMVGIANRPQGYTEEYLLSLNAFYDTCSTLIANYKTEYEYKRLKDKYDNFLSQISHDMRTPLNGIIGYKQLFEIEFKKHSINKHRCESYLEEINNCSEKLLELIDKILSITKTFTNIKLEYINLHESINKIINMVAPNAQRNSISIINELEKNILVYVDKKMFEDIITNLLTNAIKYNKIGGYIRLFNFIKDNNAFVLNIQDTGFGMKYEDIQNIFSPFYRCDNIKHIEGNGIGLTTVKKYCDLMNIKVDVQSEIDKGSTFALDLLYKKQDIHKTIIYVEDDIVNQKLIENILEDEYVIDIAEDLVHAKQKIQENEYKLYILDYNLPDGNSLELLPLINNLDHVIILTADTNETTRQNVMSKNIKHFLTKPFNLYEFMQLVKRIV